MSPSNGSAHTSFRTVQRFKLDYANVNVTQYESTRTGMRAVVVDQKGPKVNGYFALATEVHSDSGVPHTLEHLVFLGSRSFRYKGLLDKLATRAYSTTNAWTATDQTAYTLSTAGWDGFAQILPVYLEHLILPTLTDAGCYTEVHHVDGEGHDAGVVYSEMQGVQNTASELIDLKSKRLLYPEGNGFRYETGGMMEALRVLTADQIRSFHKAMYQPRNLCLVITGDVDHEDLLYVLDKFESTIVDDVPKPEDPFTRPWVDSANAPALKETVITSVKFPEEDESVGETLTCWFGPSCNDSLNSAAIDILLTYLAGSSISVLENTLVEKEQRSSGVYYNNDYRPQMVISLALSAVETDKLAETEERLIELIGEVASKPLDLVYMHDCIDRFRRQIKIRCEEAGDFFAEPIIIDHLFGNRDGSDLRELATMAELEQLEGWSDAQWRAFMKKWLVDTPHISILGEPSAEMSKKLKDEEKARVKALQDKLGEKGLKELAEKLEKAKAENDVPIPDSVIEAFPVPGTESVHFISTVSAGSGPARKEANTKNAIQRLVDADKSKSDLFIHFEHIPSNFIRVKVDLGLTAVPTELRPLISLYMTNFFTSPVKIDGKRLEFEEVVSQLERDTVGYGISNEGGNAEVLALWFELEPTRYTKVIEWIHTLLFNAIHDADRLHATLTKLVADIPEEKRSGRSMLTAVTFMVQYKQESSLRACSTLSKALYLKRTRKLLEQNPEQVINKFSELCKAISRPENIRIKVAADIEHLKEPVSSWDRLVSGKQDKPLDVLPRRKDLLSDLGKTPGAYSYIIPIPAIDSSYAVLIGKGIESYEHPDLPALLVASAYMDSVEGPMWVAVRGQGFAYGSAFTRNVDTGLLSFNIWRSPNAFKAYAAAKEQAEGYASGKLPLDRFALEGAVSSIVLGMADEQPSMASAAEASFVNQVIKNIDKDWAHKMLLRVRDVRPEQVREAMQKYMVPVFAAESASLVVTCSKLMTEELEREFSKAGFKIEARDLESFYDDYGLEAPPGGDADDEDEDDEDEDDDEDDVDTPGSEEDD